MILVTFLFVTIMAVSFVGMVTAMSAIRGIMAVDRGLGVVLFGYRGLPVTLATIAAIRITCSIVGVSAFPVTMTITAPAFADFLVVVTRVCPCRDFSVIVASMVVCLLRRLGE